MTTTTQTIFKNVAGTWMLQGPNLTAGETVTVTKKDGSTVEKVIGVVISTDPDGVSLANINGPSKPRRSRWIKISEGTCTGEPCECGDGQIYDGYCSYGNGPVWKRRY